MCINSLKTDNKLIADKDITVLKVIKKYKGKLCSPLFDTEIWKVNDEKTINLSIIKDGFDFPATLYRTTTGLYSYDISCDPKYCAIGFRFCENKDRKLEVYEAIIPKGSEYIKEGNQYCSNKLKLTKQICVL